MLSFIPKTDEEIAVTSMFKEAFGFGDEPRPMVGVAGFESGFLTKSPEVIIGVRFGLPDDISSVDENTLGLLRSKLAELNSELVSSDKTRGPIRWMVTNLPQEPVVFNIFFSLGDVTDPEEQVTALRGVAVFTEAMHHYFHTESERGIFSLEHLHTMPAEGITPEFVSQIEKRARGIFDQTLVATSTRHFDLEEMVSYLNSEGYRLPYGVAFELKRQSSGNDYDILVRPSRSDQTIDTKELDRYIQQVQKYVNMVNS